MGGRLARRVVLEHPLFVFDRSEAAVASLVERGATACSSVADLAAQCDVILLCLPTSDHVRSVIFDDGGVADSAAKGTLVLDQTTGDPVATREIAATLAARGIEFVDAPVSGGPMGADSGTIAIMVGAEESQYDKVVPILRAISPNVFHAGGIGAGHVTKLANNMLSAVNRMVSLEALTLAAKNGVDPKKALEIFLASSGRNFHLETFVADILAGHLTSGFTVGLLHKDIRLACQMGVDADVPMHLGNQVKDFYQICVNEMGREADVNVAALMMDRFAGSHIVPVDHTLAPTTSLP